MPRRRALLVAAAFVSAAASAEAVPQEYPEEYAQESEQEPDQQEGSVHTPRPVPYGALGAISGHCGYVNVHWDATGGWATDPDGSSGSCDSYNEYLDLAYCQKFWPESESIVQVGTVGTLLGCSSAADCPGIWGSWSLTEGEQWGFCAAGNQNCIGSDWIFNKPAYLCVGPEGMPPQWDQMLPHYAFGAVAGWCGKVNVHLDSTGGWATDPDGLSGCDKLGAEQYCSSDCEARAVEYCRKFYPATVATVAQGTCASLLGCNADACNEVWGSWPLSDGGVWGFCEAHNNNCESHYQHSPNKPTILCLSTPPLATSPSASPSASPPSTSPPIPKPPRPPTPLQQPPDRKSVV